jgi:serine phosphatase RsbU (regulator of sigma subunit)
MLICWYRYSRLRERVELGFLSRRVREVEHELSFARRVHEKLFPRPIDDGPIRFDFRYRPMRQIGGDFIDVHRDPTTGALTVVMIDVTGHGIAAALAVNRLHGEMKRVLASSAGASPAKLLAALNSYVHLTLADESVFATAIVMRIDPASRRLTYASAGHPPLILCRASRANGRVELLDSTAMMLGAVPPEAYETDEQATTLESGDLVLLYTDGALECRDAHDHQLGIAGIRNVVESNKRCDDPAAALDALLIAIDNHRAGEPEDDTLIAAVALAVVPSKIATAKLAAPPPAAPAAANFSVNS